MRRFLPLFPLILLGAAPVPVRPVPQGTQCLAGERVLYSCHFGKSVGSVCMSAKSVSYRFGPLGRPSIDIRSNSDWSNIHIGSQYSHALAQEDVRFTSNGYDYVVYTSEAGDLSDVPGKRFSGIAVKHGAADVAQLECRRATVMHEAWTEEVRDRGTAATHGRAELGDDDPRFDEYF